MLSVEMFPTDELVPYAGNAKIHTREQIRQIARSIEEFSFNDPVAIWNGEIVEGHGRVMAAKELGLESVPVIRLDHMTDEQRRAYTHIHNQLTMNTKIDIDALADDFEQLDFDFEMFGFDLDEILPSIDDFDTGFEIDDSDGPKVKSVALMLTPDQFELFHEIAEAVGDVEGDGNKAGNVVAEVFRQWQELKTWKSE